MDEGTTVGGMKDTTVDGTMETTVDGISVWFCFSLFLLLAPAMAWSKECLKLI